MALKPLNVLFLNNTDNDLDSVIDKAKFVVYHSDLQDDYEPTIEDTALIISKTEFNLTSKIGMKLLRFFKQGGNILCPVSNPSNFSSVRGICFQNFEDHHRFWIRQSSKWISPKSSQTLAKPLRAHFAQFCTKMNSEKEQVKLTKGFLYSEESLSNGNRLQQSRLLLDFDPVNEEASESYLPISTKNFQNCDFDWEKYSNELTSKAIGRSVIHVKVINSTFDILEGPHDLKHGLAVIAEQQAKGRGRGQNAWLSPKGCAMTSIQLKYDLKSNQGQRSSLLQHLVSLSVVHSLKDLIELNLKWPNDIYYGPKIKMGGVIVLSSIFKDQITFNIGFGFNLNNAEPTLSFNDLLKSEGHEPLSPEIYFAKVFNQLESFLDLLDEKNGLEKILALYHNYWLHEDQEVTLLDHENQKLSGTVKCVDEYGFLVVQLSNGERVSVQPGNNSFDMMQGLILPKRNS